MITEIYPVAVSPAYPLASLMMPVGSISAAPVISARKESSPGTARRFWLTLIIGMMSQLINKESDNAN